MSAQNARRLLGKLGVWTWLDGLDAEGATAFAQRVEALGYDALWLPEAVGRDPFVQIAQLATTTQQLRFATGIANIYARDPMTMNTLRNTVGELSGGRFVLGIGVSHAHLVTGVRGHEYQKPIGAMRSYLEGMEKALYRAPAPPAEPPVLLAALRPKMLALSGEQSAGAHPYFTPPEHTARARELLGPEPVLAPEQMVLLESDPATARGTARAAMKVYLGLPNYRNNLKWLGFGEDDFADGGSDRLVDAIVAWGDEAALRERIEAHFRAGADHVCIQPLNPSGEAVPHLEVLERLAP